MRVSSSFALALTLLLVLSPATVASRVLLQEGEEATGEAAPAAEGEATATESEESQGAGDVCLTADFPLEFRSPVQFNVKDGFGPFKDGSLDLQCDCAGYTCKCSGTEENCDAYSVLWFYGLAYSHQFGSFFYDMPEYERKYHLESMIFWTVLGTILFWLGLLTIIYMELKAVSITRERDERRRLVQLRAMERSSKIVDLEKKEMLVMSPRAYITIAGAILLFVGLFFQLIPFCHLLRELGIPVAFHGFCILFVFVNALVLSASIVLLVLGVLWSCTRGFAALVLIVVAIAGDLMIFGGIAYCLVWMIVAGAVLYLYFSFLPELYKDYRDLSDPNNGRYPVWLQDAGNFELETDLEKITSSFHAAGKDFVDDISNNPVGSGLKDAGAKAQEAVNKMSGQEKA
ncbi:hypothetical protein GUITHDRAFT_103606 [Guillardia theta CCMP2712]|uniref:TRP C-terminal domain-containing protein n=1 Tax=Guillardia theta (strain CCMP2712) TaxID=905079 RepID=L1JRT3_GUITC|nr:hypothetical protein GUITHDRAFT_103606 [Guillardia theta CCMP2712]EKX51019.1 hypothetical protein GUITHDRAFT_103606 [Guillardia theta CCMP2712]|eukprot:XP_005837999.1 hypothetical protein GUITHDRAFT_103606 [Guillardia theta CCMP2712]